MLNEHAKRMKLNLTEITINQDLNVREELDNDTIERYAESLEQLPPIVVFNIGDNSYLLADGFHQVKAAERLGRKEIEVELRQGTKQDTEEYAALANLRHGKPLTRAERRKAVERMLMLHPERANNWIAQDMGVSENTVKRYREELESTSQIAKLNSFIGEDGKERPREVPHPKKDEQVSDEQAEEHKPEAKLESIEYPQEAEEPKQAPLIVETDASNFRAFRTKVGSPFRGLGKNLASSLHDAAKIYKRKEGNPNAYHCKREGIRGLPGWVTPRQNCRYNPIYA